ncbi:hypothetical protein F4818DRAFT_73922 [Hypoxylon cercidicola]|nr:hypothetical protein F4818DRAFT_73922 [Hypoxylon cercidicola]
MAASRAVFIFPFNPTWVTYSGCKRLHQGLRRKILEYRAAPWDSLPPPKPTFLAIEPAPTFLLGSSAAKYDPKDEKGWLASLAERFSLQSLARTGDFFDKDNTYRLSNTQSSILTQELDIYSLRTWEHREAADENPKREATMFTCHAEVAKRLDRDLSTYVGPGQVLVWPVLDLRLTKFSGCTKGQVEQAIGSEIVTILQKFTDSRDPMYKPGSGVWVDSRYFKEPRQIADVHASVEEDILSFRAILNVENPVLGPSRINPWSRMEAADIAFNPVTSIIAEVGITGHELGFLHGIKSAKENAITLCKDILMYNLLDLFDLLPTDPVQPEEVFGDSWQSVIKDGTPDWII